MPREPRRQTIRKGTKSCIACRKRKVRCDWAPNETACHNCRSRDQVCELQVFSRPFEESTRQSTQTRIKTLEDSVAQLWSTVHSLGAHVGRAVSIGPGTSTAHQNCDDQEAHSEGESETESSHSSSADPPTHLIPLFRNELLNASEQTQRGLQIGLGFDRKCSALRQVLPSREEICMIAAHISSWLALSNSVIPTMISPGTDNGLISRYDELASSNRDPIALSSLLLTVAAAVQNAPDESVFRSMPTMRDTHDFTEKVSYVVEREVISDDNLLSTLEGIKTSVLYLRLQLSRSKTRTVYLLTRRIVALAEFIGLPQAATNLHFSQQYLDSHLQRPDTPLARRNEQSVEKAEVWESICTIDRVSSMMLSLPLSTAHSQLTPKPILDHAGQVVPRSYLFALADIASRISALDGPSQLGGTPTDRISKVFAADQQIRELAQQAPQDWWQRNDDGFTVETLLQYLHYYLTIRIHLQLALNDEAGQSAFSFISCMKACQELCRRYVAMRPGLPLRFFIGRYLDLQAFTAAVFLLLAKHRICSSSEPSLVGVDSGSLIPCVHGVIYTMDEIERRFGPRTFVRAAADAIRSIESLLQQPQIDETHQKVTIDLPLVGRLHISRSLTANTHRQTTERSSSTRIAQHSGGSTAVPTGLQAGSDVLQSANGNLTDALAYSMEVLEQPMMWHDGMFNEQWWMLE